LAAGVLEQTLATLAARGSINGLKAWLGPCIGPSAFEVGEEVLAAFVAADAQAQAAFKPLPTPGKYLADLPALARQRLAKAGVAQVQGNDGGLAWCTFNQTGAFFSHRREGVTGRFAAGISLI
jgi:copper oxidase (laccase) domain-containing protein